jgi:dipeptide/tripeptide permease
MLCYMWCLPGGLLADSVGRFKVIWTLSAVYGAGTIMVAIASWYEFQQPLEGLFLVGVLFFIPLGTGGIKPNIATFGADQIGDETKAQQDAQKKFFSFFYLAINVGVMFAFGYFINVTTHGQPPFLPAKDGYFAAYIVAAVSMFVAVGSFVGGSGLFTIQPGGGLDGFLTMVRTVGHSVKNGGGWRAYVCVLGWLLLPCFFITTFIAALQPSGDGAGVAAASGNASDISNISAATARMRQNITSQTSWRRSAAGMKR